MTTETKYIFSNLSGYQEGVTVSRERQTLSHWLNDHVLQRLMILKDVNTNIDFVEYDRFCGDLWAGLIVIPSFPITDVHSFYLGRSGENNVWRAVHYIKNDPFPKYYFQESDQKTSRPQVECLPIDWKKMREASQGGFKDAHEIKFKDAKENVSFVTRLTPSLSAPMAQVSVNKKFHPNRTITVDTSYLMKGGIFERMLLEGKKMLSAGCSAEEVGDFCEELQIAFSPYFPMD